MWPLLAAAGEDQGWAAGVRARPGRPRRPRLIRPAFRGLAVAAVVALVGVSLWTSARFAPPTTLVDPPHQTIQNACGTAGAYIANFLFESLGYGAYYLAGSLAALTVLLLLRREIDQPVVRTVGWVISLGGLTTLLTLTVPNWTPRPGGGAGGEGGGGERGRGGRGGGGRGGGGPPPPPPRR